MTGDVVHFDVDVKIPNRYGMTPEQITHLLIGRFHLLHLEVLAASSGTIGIYEYEEEPSEDG